MLQDAVMEQAFALVDQMLNSNKLTRDYGLRMRTFRIIPLHPTAGVLEWIDNSMTLGEYLVSAHERLHAADLTPRKCREMSMAEFERPSSTVASKLELYEKQICAKFHPVLRHFFLEHSKSSADWWAKRLEYAKSVGVASILGYIVGLGDRHCHNIIIDRTTGHVIHIDLNMIFDAGRMLHIPERVPFRLTRDMVDGLGPSGVGGPFFTSAEMTLTLLRKQAATIVVLLEVFKYDTLQRWDPVPLKTARRMIAEHETALRGTALCAGTGKGDGCKEANRTLARVQDKLKGVEDGATLSVRAQLNLLIQMATSPELLCQMFHGWQPWM